MQYGNQYMSPQQIGSAYQQYQQPVHGFVYVTGPDGANAYQMPPNSEMPQFASGILAGMDLPLFTILAALIMTGVVLCYKFVDDVRDRTG